MSSPQRERRPQTEAPSTGTANRQAAESTSDYTAPDLMSHALAYARAGLDVLPLTPGGKTPLGALVAHGKDNATHDAEQVRDWWVQCPTANIGVRPAAGVVVVDVDPRDGGATNLVELTRPHGGLTPTRTPFKAKLCAGVDLKHRTGYVVAPPSVHLNGRRYVWANDLPIAEAPPWLVALMAAPPPRPLSTVSAGTFSGANDGGLVRLVAAPGGDRHNRLFWAVRRAVERDGLTADLRARLVVAAASLGDEEAERTIDCAIAWPVAA